VQWVGGVYYDYGYYDYWQSFYNYIPVLFGAPEPTVLNQWIFQKAHSLSGFGQVNYSVTDKLQLTGGLRVLTETKEALNYAGFVHATTRDLSLWPAANIVRARKTWDSVTYHLDAKYQFTDDLMAYVSYSTGFLSGGFNSAAVAGAGVPPGVTSATLGPWGPETAKSFETGVRSEWFDHRLRANVTGFWTDYDSLQSFSTFLVDPRTGLTAVGPSNTGRERARGVELQTVAVPVPGLRLSASVGYLNARFTSFQTTRNNLPYDCVANHCIPVLSPEWTMHLDGAYDIHTDVGTFTPTVSYSYTSDYFTDTFNDPVGHVPAYGLFDAALNYEDPTGRWGASLWGKNLADTRYFLGFLNQPFAFTTRYFADPRTFGVEVRVKLEAPRK
jgi:iron complex outermembrane receptor protein